jgi:hypothetical protein
MKRRHLIFFLLVLVTISSCNLPASAPTEMPLPQPTDDIPVTGLNTPTPVPVETRVDFLVFPTPTLTSTPSVVLASAREQPVNCRFGPDISYAVVGALIVGRQAQVIGKNILRLRAQGITFAIIEHDMDVIAELCDPIYVLAEGRTLTKGTFREVASNRQVMQAYLGKVA